MSSVTLQMTLAFAFGVVFIVALLVFAVRFPNPTSFQYTVFRIVLAVAAAGVAAMVPGFLALNVTSGSVLLIRAGGALAVFVMVFFFKPASLGAVQNSANTLAIPPAPATLPNGAPFPPEKREAFTQVWAALGEVYVAAEALWREVSDSTLTTFAQKLGRAQECIIANALFFSDADFDAITAALNSANFYLDGKRQLSDLYDAEGRAGGLAGSSAEHAFIVQSINRQIDTNRQWLGEYRSVLARLRSSLHERLVA